MRHTVSVLVENRAGVLARVAGLFRRRGFNIESLAVGPTEDPTISRMTIAIDTDEFTVEQVIRQLDKLIEVLSVEKLHPAETISRELALIKVQAGPAQRAAIIQIVDVFRANVIDVGKETLIVEVTGEEDKVNALLELLQDYGIKEIARTGTVALSRGPKCIAKPEGEDDSSWQGFTTTRMPI